LCDVLLRVRDVHERAKHVREPSCDGGQLYDDPQLHGLCVLLYDDGQQLHDALQHARDGHVSFCLLKNVNGKSHLHSHPNE
jgi:hypothetical protein